MITLTSDQIEKMIQKGTVSEVYSSDNQCHFIKCKLTVETPHIECYPTSTYLVKRGFFSEFKQDVVNHKEVREALEKKLLEITHTDHKVVKEFKEMLEV